MHHATSKVIFEKTNRLSEKLTEIIMLISTKVMPFVSLLPTFILSFFNYFTKKPDEDTFQFVLPLWYASIFKKLSFSVQEFWLNILFCIEMLSICDFVYRFPFNSKQPLGYIVAFIAQNIVAFCLFTITSVCVAVGFGTFLLAISMTNDIRDDLSLINKNAKNKKKIGRALKQLGELIQYHSDAKQLIESIFCWDPVAKQ